VPGLITERIKKLRREIAELSEKNCKYSLDPRYGSAVADNARRFQRLMEIVEELKSLTDGKSRRLHFKSTFKSSKDGVRKGTYSNFLRGLLFSSDGPPPAWWTILISEP
jgi:hypothetical protein